MNIYQFIKYSDTASIEEFIPKEMECTVFCFDLEDSIQDTLDPFNTRALKSYHRAILKLILKKISIQSNRMAVGVRINDAHTKDYALDIEALAGAGPISSVFLPKAIHAEQVMDLQNRLELAGVHYTEIIPVIETKNGLHNLESILNLKSDKIKSIAFGHCDYNLDNDIYPFIHQDAREYWNWVIRIFNRIRPYQLSFVNSPFLQLENDARFNDMLALLYSVCQGQFGQITLTARQTHLCRSFIPDHSKIITEKVANPLNLSVQGSYAYDFINLYHGSEKRNGFAITRDRVILSPHEYHASHHHILKSHLPQIHFTFVGGCFPVKGNVLFENRFHQLIKMGVENKCAVNFNVNIVRYERYMNCMNRISASENVTPVDILVFSIRPEPFLRLVKLYYKYADDTNGKIKWSLNLPFLNKINPEKHDVLTTDTRFHPAMLGTKSMLRKVLINLNYLFGLVIGNGHYSSQEYLQLLHEVIGFCKIKNIQLLVLGPAIRTNTFIEKWLSRKLDKFFRKSLPILPDQYVSGADLHKNGEPLFEKNGIYVNEKYHQVIAERLGNKVMKIIEKRTPQEERSSDIEKALFFKY